MRLFVRLYHLYPMSIEKYDGKKRERMQLFVFVCAEPG